MLELPVGSYHSRCEEIARSPLAAQKALHIRGFGNTLQARIEV